MKKLLALLLISVMVFTMAPAASAAFTFPFTDVPTSHPHRAAIEYCAENGFVKGVSSTKFDPDGTLTREQMAVIWARTFHVGMHKFSDVQKITHEMDNAIIVMSALGFFKGVSETQFSRYAKISREDVATVTGRTYLPGFDGEDSYLDYADHASIAQYARDGVSACKFAGLFDGVFEGSDFKPRQAITRGEISHIIYNVMRTAYTVTIAPMTGGNVTASHTKAYAGQLIPLTVTPGTSMQLKAGTLKANGTAITGTTFTMPDHDVTITAEFEAIPIPVPTLVSIAITTQPDKTAYVEGENLDLTGMVVTATYDDSSTDTVTGYTTSIAEGTPLTLSDTDITVSYTEDSVTKDTILTITVVALL